MQIIKTGIGIKQGQARRRKGCRNFKAERGLNHGEEAPGNKPLTAAPDPRSTFNNSHIFAIPSITPP
jgi:hypothetical protein